MAVEGSRRIAEIRIDAGSAVGLKKGMEFFVHIPTRVYGTALLASEAGTEASENLSS